MRDGRQSVEWREYADRKPQRPKNKAIQQMAVDCNPKRIVLAQ